MPYTCADRDKKRETEKQGSGNECTPTGRIGCAMPPDSLPESMPSPAVTFLKAHGHAALVSLGCGEHLNRIDNHLRLVEALNLSFYVGVDCVSRIEPVSVRLFMNPKEMKRLIDRYYGGRSRRFWKTVILFPGTFVQDLEGTHCAAVVCQRVYPGFSWEKVIISMTPKLVLQEDLHGCERQKLRGPHYVRNWSNIRRFNLKPFRPWPIFPWEKNLVLWRRRDFGGKKEADDKLWWLQRLAERFIG